MPQPSLAAVGEPRQILIRGVNWLGDAVMITPALQRLRQRFSQSRLILLTSEKLADLYLNHPAIDQVMTYSPGESPWSIARRIRTWRLIETLTEFKRRALRPDALSPIEATQALGRAAGKALEALASQPLGSTPSFDLALILPNSPRTALEAWLARIPQRIGYAAPWRNWFLTHALAHRPEHQPMRRRSSREIKELTSAPRPGATRATGAAYDSSAHQTYEYLHLVAAVGASAEPLAPYLVATSAEVGVAAKKFGLQPEAIGDRPIFGLNAGAEYGPAKRWPSEKFIAAARRVQQQTDCLWVILGAQADVGLSGQIEQGISAGPFPKATSPAKPLVANLTGKTSLRQLCAVLKLCDVLLTNDTGPMHVAAALGTPVVVPFGSTSPELTGPGLPTDSHHQLLRSKAPCSPCFRRACPIDLRCLTGISVDSVVEALLQATAKSGR